MTDLLASKRTPGPDVNIAPKLLSITGSLHATVLILFGGRIYTRSRLRQLGWDDYTITFALVVALVEWALVAVAIHYGAGRHNYYLSTTDQVLAQYFIFVSSVLWVLSIMFIKISIAYMLLRIKHTPAWRILLWTMIAVQILSCIASLVLQLVQCVPLAYMWDPTAHPHANCTAPTSTFVSIYVNSGIGITTDVIFALLPISFIRKMHYPLLEKIALSLLMGLGVFAAAASAVKITLVRDYGQTGDTLWDAMDLTLWSILEEQTGIVAACIPCLKAPFEHTLHRFGILFTRKNGSGYHSNRHHTHRNAADMHQQMTPFRLPTIRNHFGISVDTHSSSSLEPHTTSYNAQSTESVWPYQPQVQERHHQDQNQDKAFRGLVAEGGILLTTEFQIKSECLSRVGSRDGETGGLEREREREMKEWRVERPSTEGRNGGWSVV